MPPLDEIGTIGGAGTDQELCASVPAVIPPGAPIKLQVRIRNDTDQPFRFNALGFGTFEHLGIWVMHSGKEVQRTSEGWVWEPVRGKNSDIIAGSMVDGRLDADQSEAFEFELRDLFQIVDPGAYTVVVQARKVEGMRYYTEGWPVATASKTSFLLIAP